MSSCVITGLNFSSAGGPASWQGCFCPIFHSYSRQLETNRATRKTIYDLDATILIKQNDEECEKKSGESRQDENAVSREIAHLPLRK